MNTQDYIGEQRIIGERQADKLTEKMTDDFCRLFFIYFFEKYPYQRDHIGYALGGVKEYIKLIHPRTFENIRLDDLERDYSEGKLTELEDMLTSYNTGKYDNYSWDELTKEQVEELKMIDILSEIVDTYQLPNKKVQDEEMYKFYSEDLDFVETSELIQYETILSIVTILYQDKKYGNYSFIDLQSCTGGYFDAFMTTIRYYDLYKDYEELRKYFTNYMNYDYFNYRVEDFFIDYLKRHEETYSKKYLTKSDFTEKELEDYRNYIQTINWEKEQEDIRNYYDSSADNGKESAEDIINKLDFSKLAQNYLKHNPLRKDSFVKDLGSIEEIIRYYNEESKHFKLKELTEDFLNNKLTQANILIKYLSYGDNLTHFTKEDAQMFKFHDVLDKLLEDYLKDNVILENEGAYYLRKANYYNYKEINYYITLLDILTMLYYYKNEGNLAFIEVDAETNGFIDVLKETLQEQGIYEDYESSFSNVINEIASAHFFGSIANALEKHIVDHKEDIL